MGDATYEPGLGTVAALLAVIVASVWLGAVAQRAVRKGSFVRGYFLGNRGLGAWAMALTATVQSGGTFMGFPSLVYTHGWVVTLWIAAYMVVPITSFAVLGKRMAQLSRRTGAVTVPDLFRERFGSAAVGLTASLLIMFFLTAMMIAQFKAGAIVMKLSLPGTNALSLAEEAAPGGIDRAYYFGLAVFALTVVGYTMMGGFLASVWTDLFQSILMFVGVLLLICLAVPLAGGLEQATRTAVAATGPAFASGPGYAVDGRTYLPIGLAFSFFFLWIFAGVGSPSSLVRVMACSNSQTLRRSIVLLGAYNIVIYLGLIAVCISGRALMPNVAASDEIIPRLALATTQKWFGGSFIAGLILAAPFGAVMATVSSYLVVIASGLVRDVYQRFIDRAANEQEIKRLTYFAMIVVGGIAVAANIRPVQYLQAIVVFSGTGQAATFAVPALMIAFWRRATAAGILSAMLAGAGTVLLLFVLGIFGPQLATLWPALEVVAADPMIGPQTAFRPYYLAGVDPVIWGLIVSLTAGVAVSLATRPPAEVLLARVFDGANPALVE
jgi:sodium/pantothenate symporter